ncbi:Oxygen-independent coproporphyrinogen-III oxidase [Porphyromonas cangingivalis]|uniref:radical SAM family heme chaperone HemW n=1 Tax=Porphyromonas cangingivalis TaxID=36874 RepID=UPI000D998039|nr:radical SAM family heme chaperone HemW [Porphyromonas cangingivalis]SPY34652.1 Oxygen-independent coproporphyrinogen-III oxidase [Porphyromonas cangingivalis]
MAGIYIHVPFCVSKCSYCDFYSVATLKKMQDYIQALKRELKVRRYELDGHTVDTVYWGGGTPSLLSEKHISEIMCLLRDTYNISDNAEITIECNPGDYNKQRISHIIGSGINRFSLGAQSFSDDTLKLLGRRHSAKETETMFTAIRELGIHNISLDLIYGIPGSDIDDLNRDIDTLIKLHPTHISAYHLIYEEGTPMYYALEQGRISELPEELSLEMSHTVSQRLQDAGYEHYEVSSYALPGMRSRHNSSYWEDIPYIGLGPSAHSYIHPWRSTNPSNLTLYVESLTQQDFLLRDFEYITVDLAFEEYLMTHLRTSDGISLETVRSRFGQEKAAHLQTRINLYVSEGLMAEHNERIRFTQRGLDISNTIISSLF